MGTGRGFAGAACFAVEGGTALQTLCQIIGRVHLWPQHEGEQFLVEASLEQFVDQVEEVRSCGGVSRLGSRNAGGTTRTTAF
jgi:hypothetical protein